MIHNQGAKSNFLSSRLAPSQQEKLLSLDFHMPSTMMSSRAKNSSGDNSNKAARVKNNQIYQPQKDEATLPEDP